jgi:hypothetical protein
MAEENLATVADVKERLRLPSASDAQDVILGAFLDAVEEEILAMTGYVVTADPTTDVVTFTQEFSDLQLGKTYELLHRPVLDINLDPPPFQRIRLEARSLASNTFSLILGEVKDTARGRFVALASEGFPEYPPTGGTGEWYRWRQITWPVVRATYRVDPLGSATNLVPKVFRTAAIEWTVSMYARSGGGALQSLSVGKVSETYIKDSMPPVVAALLARYIRGRATLVS